MVIGLLGGSFDPAHEGHVHISREALKRMNLDQVWWLVTPGNPLKARQPAPMAERLARARTVMPDPRVRITDLEAKLGTRATADTIDALRAIYPGVHFVWLMGADNLASFHRWNEWRAIARMMPIAIIDRPGSTHSAMASPAANWLSRWRLPESRAASLPRMQPPAWVFLHGKRSTLSSTMLRRQAGRD